MLQIRADKKKVKDAKEGDILYIDDVEAEVRKIKKGGIGKVYIIRSNFSKLACKNMPLPCNLAIKLIDKSYLDDIKIKTIFKEELFNWSLLAPQFGTVPLSAILEDESSQLIAAMPAYDGTSWNYMEQRKQNGYHHFHGLFCMICWGLGTLHLRNILHLDIKPTNILFKENQFSVLFGEGQTVGSAISGNKMDYEFALSDFGISKVLEEAIKIELKTNQELDNNTTNSICGTIPYMAPERFNKTYKSQKSADIYSLGISAIELLTGQLPLRKGPIGYVHKQITNGEYYKNAEYLLKRNNINKNISDLFLKLIQYKEEKRPANLVEIASEYNTRLKDAHRKISFLFWGRNIKTSKTSKFLGDEFEKKEDKCKNKAQCISPEQQKIIQVEMASEFFKKKYMEGIPTKKINILSETLKVDINRAHKLLRFGALFEIENIKNEVEALKNTGHNYSTIGSGMFPRLTKIQEFLLQFASHDTKAFSVNCSEFVIPEMVYYNKQRFSSIITSPFSFSFYLYFNCLAKCAVDPGSGLRDKISVKHGELSKTIYFYFISLPVYYNNASPAKISSKNEKTMQKSDTDALIPISIILYNKKFHFYHCLSIRVRAKTYYIETSKEWVHKTKNKYGPTKLFFNKQGEKIEPDALKNEAIINALYGHIEKISFV